MPRFAEKSDPVYVKEVGPSYVAVYPNRVVIHQWKNIFVQNDDVILFSNIASIELAGITKKLRIISNDGKTHEAPWLVGPIAMAVKQTIEELP